MEFTGDNTSVLLGLGGTEIREQGGPWVGEGPLRPPVAPPTPHPRPSLPRIFSPLSLGIVTWHSQPSS